MNPTTLPHPETLIGTLAGQFPDALYYTPAMISKALGFEVAVVRYYCRQLFPCHDGYYRFWLEGGSRCTLSNAELKSLLRLMYQSTRCKRTRNEPRQ